MKASANVKAAVSTRNTLVTRKPARPRVPAASACLACMPLIPNSQSRHMLTLKQWTTTHVLVVTASGVSGGWII
jgi:hypothetical protein